MKILKTMFGMAICLCFLFFVGCGPNAETQTPSNIKDSKTKDYYEKIGYYDIAFSDCFDIDGELVYFSDGTILVKPKTAISISFNDDSFERSNYYFVNYKTSEILTGIKINGEVYSLDNFDLENYTVKSPIEIKPVISKFSIYGVAIIVDDETISDGQNVLGVHDESLLKNKSLQFLISNGDNFEQDVAADNIESSIEYVIEQNQNNYNLKIEFDTELVDYSCMAILKTDDGSLYLTCLENKNDKYCFNEKCNLNITIELTESLRKK